MGKILVTLALPGCGNTPTRDATAVLAGWAQAGADKDASAKRAGIAGTIAQRRATAAALNSRAARR